MHDVRWVQWYELEYMTCFAMMYNIWATIIYNLCVKCSWSGDIDVLSYSPGEHWTVHGNSPWKHLEKFLSVGFTNGPLERRMVHEYKTRKGYPRFWIFNFYRSVRCSQGRSTGTSAVETKCWFLVSILMNCLVFSVRCSPDSPREHNSCVLRTSRMES